MSAELARAWLGYAKENCHLARLALDAGLINPSLQNSQQAIEKSLKAVWVGSGKIVRKTHCVADLVEDLASIGCVAAISEDDCFLVDSIYMPSKYPAEAVLPEGPSEGKVASQCLELAGRVCQWAQHVLDDARPK